MFLRLVGAVVALLPAERPALPPHNVAEAIRYSAGQLNCARFLESSETKIFTQSARRDREQTAGRTAVWRFRASPLAEGIALEGWLDSLSLWRRSSETTIRPDTDGLLGGRYRGVLASNGSYASRVVPFIPDGVAEVADMSPALQDFFPPLPAGELRPGEAWRDSAGMTLRRLADSGMSGVPLYRFELKSRGVSKIAAVPGDTTQLDLRQVSQEHGTFVWHPSLGLIRRERLIVVETAVPASRLVRQAVRSRIEQRITLARDLHTPHAASGKCPV